MFPSFSLDVSEANCWCISSKNRQDRLVHHCVNGYIFCIHYYVGGHLGSFQLLVIINKAAINRMEHVSLLYVEAPFGYIPRRGGSLL